MPVAAAPAGTRDPPHAPSSGGPSAARQVCGPAHVDGAQVALLAADAVEQTFRRSDNATRQAWLLGFAIVFYLARFVAPLIGLVLTLFVLAVSLVARFILLRNKISHD